MIQEYPIGDADAGKPRWVQEYCDGELCEGIREYSYGQSGLCPVLIGDILGGKNMQDGKNCSFEVIGKLGHGSYSTVWLVKNKETGVYHALKILRSEHSSADNIELKILKDTNALQFSFFYTHVPMNRRHLCLVMQPSGSTLAQRSWASDEYEVLGCPWDVASISMFTEALLVKVFSFHELGIYHGDLSPGNVTLGVSEDAFTPEAMQKTFGRDLRGKVFLAHSPRSEPQPPIPPCLPAYITRHEHPLASDGWDFSLLEIIDFGQGGYESRKTKLMGTPYYIPPEHNIPRALASIQADLWSLGCVLFYGLMHDHLFWVGGSLEEYLAANNEEQVSIIDGRLKDHPVFQKHIRYRQITSKLLQSLIRADPRKRDKRRANELLDKLIDYANEHLEYENGEE
ncbi:serine/threonine-protein kinase [Trichophyton mentagrophytes]|nr:Serine/threonine-protein kinase [Trichophyton interdigitale]KAG5218346.1 Serine/threonine-protein kinase [Trichophyton interdigitale]KAG8206238.1 Serine/threonine-protein kinase [Trichophyton interdigitale]GBF63658.1 serine/threonine-protein kinase [Trichophyton mentagrophytes]